MDQGDTQPGRLSGSFEPHGSRPFSAQAANLRGAGAVAPHRRTGLTWSSRTGEQTLATPSLQAVRDTLSQCRSGMSVYAEPRSDSQCWNASGRWGRRCPLKYRDAFPCVKAARVVCHSRGRTMRRVTMTSSKRILMLITVGTIAGNVADSSSGTAGLVQTELAQILSPLREAMQFDWGVDIDLETTEGGKRG
jgi:hypothetical protein